MRRYTVYLAGPISGCTYAGCVDWRQVFKDSMPDCIAALSPMRGKAFLDDGSRIDPRAYDENVLSTQEGILCRDHFDCCRADVIIVNLQAATAPSIGTCMEIAWGHHLNTPMIFIMDEEDEVHDHPMILAARKFRVDTVTAACRLVCLILDTEAHGA